MTHQPRRPCSHAQRPQKTRTHCEGYAYKDTHSPGQPQAVRTGGLAPEQQGIKTRMGARAENRTPRLQRGRNGRAKEREKEGRRVTVKVGMRVDGPLP